MINLRDYAKKLSPPWLSVGVAEKILYTYGLMFDMLGDAAVAAVQMRFPGAYSWTSLPLIGRDRQVPRGLAESNSDYANRLRGWWDTHRGAGNPYCLLKQIYAATGFLARYWIINDRACRWVYDPVQSHPYTYGPPSGPYTSWDDAGHITQYSYYGMPSVWGWGPEHLPFRFWVVIELSSVDQIGLPPVWAPPPPSGRTADRPPNNTQTLGSTATPALAQTIRNLVRSWKPAFMRCESIIITWDSFLFDNDGPVHLRWEHRYCNAAYWQGAA
jgi:hypothetical protein